DNYGPIINHKWPSASEVRVPHFKLPDSVEKREFLAFRWLKPRNVLEFIYMEQSQKVDSVKKIMSPCDVEALKKCLEENKGDYVKCQTQIEAFKSSCALKKPSQTPL
ncbi:hypothetical protein V2J09_011238, partial [Rumex salicifolius]